MTCLSSSSIPDNRSRCSSGSAAQHAFHCCLAWPINSSTNSSRALTSPCVTWSFHRFLNDQLRPFKGHDPLLLDCQSTGTLLAGVRLGAAAMSTSNFELASPPTEPRERGPWLQHAAAFILFEDARRYALSRLDRGLDDSAKEAAQRAIDDTLYGLMMVIDGVTGALTNEDLAVHLDVAVQLVRRRGQPQEILQRIALREGDGMCMGYHGWVAGDFGAHKVASPKL